jgi:hypothetical protein
MSRRYLHHLWARLRPIKTWYLVVAFLVSTVVCVMALRANYAGMVKLREAVYAADQNDGDVEQALQKLRSYVGQHMNTSLDTGNGVYPPIQLKYTYERLVRAEQERVGGPNSDTYTDAQRYCERLNPDSFFGRERIPCIQQYIKDHPTAKARAIPDALYKFDFATPRWSPDLAGWTLVLSSLLLVLTIIRYALGRWLPKATK